MTTACALDTDCTAPATCVLKPTGRQGSLTEPEPMHTYWPFGYNRTTYAWTYGFCPQSTPSATAQCCCETDATKVAYFEECATLYPTYLSWMTSFCGTNDMKMVPLTRQNVTVASLATKVTLRLCRGECLDDIDIALKYDVRVDANGPLAWGTDGAALAAGENGPYESTTMNVVGSGGHPNAQRYGVVGGKVALTLPLDLETADDYRILVHEESTGLTCRSDYFTIANAGEVPTPQPFYACCRAEIEQSLPVARLHAGPRRFRLWKFYLHTPREKTSL